MQCPQPASPASQSCCMHPGLLPASCHPAAYPILSCPAPPAFFSASSYPSPSSLLRRSSRARGNASAARYCRVGHVRLLSPLYLALLSFLSYLSYLSSSPCPEPDPAPATTGHRATRCTHRSHRTRPPSICTFLLRAAPGCGQLNEAFTREEREHLLVLVGVSERAIAQSPGPGQGLLLMLRLLLLLPSMRSMVHERRWDAADESKRGGEERKERPTSPACQRPRAAGGPVSCACSCIANIGHHIGHQTPRKLEARSARPGLSVVLTSPTSPCSCSCILHGTCRSMGQASARRCLRLRAASGHTKRTMPRGQLCSQLTALGSALLCSAWLAGTPRACPN